MSLRKPLNRGVAEVAFGTAAAVQLRRTWRTRVSRAAVAVHWTFAGFGERRQPPHPKRLRYLETPAWDARWTDYERVRNLDDDLCNAAHGARFVRTMTDSSKCVSAGGKYLTDFCVPARTLSRRLVSERPSDKS